MLPGSRQPPGWITLTDVFISYICKHFHHYILGMSMRYAKPIRRCSSFIRLLKRSAWVIDSIDSSHCFFRAKIFRFTKKNKNCTHYAEYIDAGHCFDSKISTLNEPQCEIKERRSLNSFNNTENASTSCRKNGK